jgi:hypothetical protein
MSYLSEYHEDKLCLPSSATTNPILKIDRDVKGHKESICMTLRQEIIIKERV